MEAEELTAEVLHAFSSSVLLICWGGVGELGEIGQLGEIVEDRGDRYKSDNQVVLDYNYYITMYS